jgi:phosphoserine aminotransferase
MPLPWDKLDAVTWSWQKVLGGEAAHGMLALSPRAVERLESYTPPWPLPKLFRMTKGGKLNEDIFKGSTINTPSMLCVEDALDTLRWAESIGGLSALIARSQQNLSVLAAWVEVTPWVEFLAQNPAYRSSTSICLSMVEPWFQAFSKEAKMAYVKKMTGLLDKKGVAYDIASYIDAPPGLRIWGGSTIESSDVQALTPWLDWAYAASRENA